MADVDNEADLQASDALADIEEHIRVEQALARLKPDDQILLALRYYRDLQLDDIAELLGVPTGTVKSRLNAAHGKLRSTLGRPEETA
jgi:RNA polymerase sigma-70 factor (ECF subfamily)